jgi:hypothetical protein
MWAVHWLSGSNEDPGQRLLEAAAEGDADAVRALLENGGLDVVSRKDEVRSRRGFDLCLREKRVPSHGGG